MENKLHKQAKGSLVSNLDTFHDPLKPISSIAAQLYGDSRAATPEWTTPSELQIWV